MKPTTFHQPLNIKSVLLPVNLEVIQRRIISFKQKQRKTIKKTQMKGKFVMIEESILYALKKPEKIKGNFIKIQTFLGHKMKNMKIFLITH